jgi:YidC/Oxa1 family membrane protein insertase
VDPLGFIYTILTPIEWVVELILFCWHWLFTALGFGSATGITWVLSIVGLVIVVRSALIPIFVRQIKNQRRMLEVAPQLKKIQDKYKGKKDQYSREAMSRETMALYKDTGTNPLSSCLPILIQLPIFFSLYHVLSNAQAGKGGVGLLNETLTGEFAKATLFGIAPLKESFGSQFSVWTNGGTPNVAVMVLAGIMVVLMVASQFYTQLQIVSKNMSPETKASPQFRQQRILLYLLPFVFLFTGVAFPLALVFYYLVSNIWTMGQQFLVIRSMPTPGSDAAKAREARLARRGKVDKLAKPVGGSPIITVEEIKKPETTQRQQPVSKARAKRQQQQRPQGQRPQGQQNTQQKSSGQQKPGQRRPGGTGEPGTAGGSAK